MTTTRARDLVGLVALVLASLTHVQHAEAEAVVGQVDLTSLNAGMLDQRALRVKDDMIKVAMRKAGSLPLVFAHGMGDSCFNPGMAQVTEFSGQYLGVYSTCIGDGDNQPEDTTNGFFMNMNKQVEHFAAKVRADAKLSKGFSAVGLSQGNLVIRGYIERFNDPPVHGFLSINGPLAGTASLPRCNPEGWVGYLCKKATDLVGDAAYSALIQDHIAQANFLKIPGENKAYLASNTFLPFLNNEVDHKDAASYKTRFASLSRLVLVKAKKDTMIFPRETAWFAYFDDESFEHLLPFNQTKAYVSDAFGLRTLAEAGRILFRESPGDHLQFSLDLLQGWLRDLAGPTSAWSEA